MHDLKRSIDAVRQADEVMEADARGPVAEVYEDVRRRLRVPFVNFVFRALASRPEELVELWRTIAPGVSTCTFEDAADRLRREAVPGDAPPEPRPGFLASQQAEGVRDFHDTIHYVLPKLLLVATAMDDGLATDGTVEEDCPVGPVSGATGAPMLPRDEAEGRVAEIYDDVESLHDHPGVASYYRALGHHPEVLEEVWGAVRPRVRTEAYDALGSRLRGLATDLACEVWPREREARRGEAHLLLTCFRGRLIPDLLIDVCWVSALRDGAEAARKSRFSE